MDHRPSRLQVLLVGMGSRITAKLLPALRAAAVPLEVIAVCDPDPATPARVTALADVGLLPVPVAAHDQLHLALASAVYDMAIVACPHEAHQAVVLELADAGIVVWKEKPFAMTVDDAVELANRVTTGLRVLTHRPHGQLYMIAARLLPAWGALLSYRIRVTRQTPDYSTTWRASRRSSGGGAILDLGYHALDLIARLAAPAITVYAVTARSPQHRVGVDVEESAHLTITHADGAVGTVYVSRCDDPADEVHLVAERGTATITGGRARMTVTEPGGFTHFVDLTADDDPLVRMIRHHAGTLHDPVVTATELDIGVRATALIEAAYTSLAAGAEASVAQIIPLPSVIPEGLPS